MLTVRRATSGSCTCTHHNNECFVAWGCCEKCSGATMQGWAKLKAAVDLLEYGDVLLVTRIDRIASNVGDLLEVVRIVKAKGASLLTTKRSTGESGVGASDRNKLLRLCLTS